MKNIFIITGTTRGLGEAFVNILSREDSRVITINRQEINYLNKNINIKMDLSKINLNDIEKFESILAKQIRDVEKIVFINNAFTMGRLNKIDKLKNDNIEESINVNFISAFLLIKSFINKTKDIKVEKRILNISSGAANKAIDGWSIYCTTKSAMEMLMHNIELEYFDYQCNNIDPGVMDTQMQSLIRNFKKGDSNEYFMELFEKNELRETAVVAKKIIEEYGI